jgi:acyl-CoA dehydrogenase
MGWLLRPFALWSRLHPIASPPSDRDGKSAAATILAPGRQRDRVTAGIFVPSDRESALGRLEHALALAVEARAVERKIRKGETPTSEEAELLRRAAAARREAVSVDSFSLDDYLNLTRSAAELGQPVAV